MRSPLKLMLPLITHPALCSCMHAEAQHATAITNMLVRTMVHILLSTRLRGEDRQRWPVKGLAVGGARNCAALPVSLLRLSVALARVPDLLVCAKHLFVAARLLDLSQPSKARSTQKNSAFSSTAASRFAIA